MLQVRIAQRKPHGSGFVILVRKTKPLTDAERGAPLDLNVNQ
jgi:hypothetical protein